MLSACIICHFYIVNTAPVGRLSIHFCTKNYVHIAIDTKKALVHDSIQIIHSIFTDIHMHSCTFTFAIITTMLVYLSFFSSLAYWWREGGGNFNNEQTNKNKTNSLGNRSLEYIVPSYIIFFGVQFSFSSTRINQYLLVGRLMMMMNAFILSRYAPDWTVKKCKNSLPYIGGDTPNPPPAQALRYFGLGCFTP